MATDAPPAAPAAVEPTLPVLRYQAPAVYPPEALAAGTGASVLMVLDIDAEGTVVAASVSEPAG